MVSFGIGSDEYEQLTITTYYPSPTGVYMRLRIYPHEIPTGSALTAGTIYYDDNLDMLRYYNKTNTWINLTNVGCVIVPFNDDATADECPAGYKTWSAVASGATGDMLCCKTEN